jgi:hypothetical protein
MRASAYRTTLKGKSQIFLSFPLRTQQIDGLRDETTDLQQSSLKKKDPPTKLGLFSTILVNPRLESNMAFYHG